MIVLFNLRILMQRVSSFAWSNVRSAALPDVRSDQQDNRAQISADPTRSTVHLAIAVLMARINDKLALFWKIPKHWLSTVSDYLDRSFTPYVRDIFNKRALSYAKAQ